MYVVFVVTHTDDSRVSNAISGVCDSVCVCVCVVRMIDKTKTADITIIRLNIGIVHDDTSPPPINIGSKGQRSRSRGQKCKKAIEWRRELCTLSSAQNLVVAYTLHFASFCDVVYM